MTAWNVLGLVVLVAVLALAVVLTRRHRVWRVAAVLVVVALAVTPGFVTASHSAHGRVVPAGSPPTP